MPTSPLVAHTGNNNNHRNKNEQAWNISGKTKTGSTTDSQNVHFTTGRSGHSVDQSYSHFFLPDMFQACSFLFLWLLLLPVCVTSGEVDIPWISRTPIFFYQICSKLASLEHIW
jgi:hypothetical protein